MGKIDEVFEIEDVRVLEVLNNPTRLRILRHLEEPTTVRAVADAMAVPVTRLYYHFGLLEDLGVIEVVETRKAGAMIERLFQCVAGTFAPSPKLYENNEDLGRVARASADAILDGARLDAEQGLFHHFEALAEGKEKSDKYPGTISRSVRLMSREEANEFAAELEELVSKWGRGSSEEEERGDEEFALSLVFFPLATPARRGQS